MDIKRLNDVRAEAKNRLSKDGEPPWARFNLMKLVEVFSDNNLGR